MTASRDWRSAPLRNWLHRHGIARTLNETYAGGWRGAYVQTRVPGRLGFLLARYACHRWGVRVRSVQREGFMEWRWRLVPQTATSLPDCLGSVGMTEPRTAARLLAPELEDFLDDQHATAYYRFRRVGLNGEASLALAAAGLTPTTVAALEAERAAERHAS